MNSFSILNKEGVVIAINTLDAEACAFWNIPVQERSYASPFSAWAFTNENNLEGEELEKAKRTFSRNKAMMETVNWYDEIGWNIANQGQYTSGWNNVVIAMLRVDGKLLNTDNKEEVEVNDISVIAEKIKNLIEFKQPFIDLVKHWQSKGYQPKQIKE